VHNPLAAQAHHSGETDMSTITTKDGTTIVPVKVRERSPPG
jgi:hypothetical protein